MLSTPSTDGDSAPCEPDLILSMVCLSLGFVEPRAQQVLTHLLCREDPDCPYIFSGVLSPPAREDFESFWYHDSDDLDQVS